MISATAHDPVCHMDIDMAGVAGTSEYEGKTYYFCSLGCKKDFDSDAPGVLEAEAAYDHSQAMEHGVMTMGVGVPAKKPWWKFWA